MLLLLCGLAAATEDINDLLSTYNQHSVFDVPLLTNKELNQLRAGQLVKRIDGGKNEQDPLRGVAYKIAEHSRDSLWIACQDEHLVTESSAQYLMVEELKPDHLNWYGFIDLPWPVDDRHWVTSSWNNHDLSKATNDQMWEHPWRLKTEWKHYRSKIDRSCTDNDLTGISSEMIDKAIYLPSSQGAWGMINLPSGTLILYHATATVGGYIPTDLMLSFLMRGLDDMFAGLERNASTKARTHYDSKHLPIYGGDGILIPPAQ